VKLHKRAWNRMCIWGYGIQARGQYLSHLWRGHDVRFRACPDLWCGITGCIECNECPDTDGRGLSIWCRNNSLLWWFGKRVCGLIGHPGVRYPQKPDGTGTGTWIDATDSVYCARCMSDMPFAAPVVRDVESA
jgi:hypothetical protein